MAADRVGRRLGRASPARSPGLSPGGSRAERTASPGIQRRQARVTVKYDRRELQRRLDTEKWIDGRLEELYRGRVRGTPGWARGLGVLSFGGTAGVPVQSARLGQSDSFVTKGSCSLARPPSILNWFLEATMGLTLRLLGTPPLPPSQLLVLLRDWGAICLVGRHIRL